MATIKMGGANQIPPAPVNCEADKFENKIRELGVVFACEWFGHDMDSEFTKETIETLCERSGVDIDGNEIDTKDNINFERAF